MRAARVGAAGVTGAARRAAIAAALVAAFAGAACAPRAEREGAAGPDSAAGSARAGAAAESDTARWILADALGPPLGPDAPLLRELEPHLAEWLALWRHADPTFEPALLVRGATSRFRPERSADDSMAWTALEGERVPGFDWVVSPDSARAVDPDWYTVLIGAEEGLLSVAHDADSCPVVYDLATRRAHWLGTWGTCCRRDGAFWLDAQRFVVWGFRESMFPEPYRWRGALDLYDLRDSTWSTLYTPEIGAPQLDAYEAAYESWAIGRFGGPARK